MIYRSLICSVLLSACTLSQPLNSDEAQDLIPYDLGESSTVSKKPLTKGRPLIFTSTYFLNELVRESLAKDQNWEVKMIFEKNDQDPALDVPNDQIIMALQKAQAIILNGARFEKGLVSVDLPRMFTIKTAQVFKSEWLKYPKEFVQEHQHGQSQSHKHTGIDGHTWMSPIRLKSQYQSLVSRLASLQLKLRPQNVKVVLHKIDQIHQKWTELALRLKQSKICVVATHPAYQYLAKDYDFKMIHFTIDPTLSAKQVLSVIDMTQIESLQTQCPSLSQTKMLWWESRPSTAVLDRLKNLNYKNIIIRPMEQNPIVSAGHKEDLFVAISHDLDQLSKALQ